MSSIFKTLERKDIRSTRTLLHEAIPVTGTIVSGTVADSGFDDENIKNYSHGIFQSVYDYPYLSSSANHIFDLTVGYSNNSSLSSSTNPDNKKKINIYNQMAKVLVGHDITGSILEFDKDGDIVAGGTKLRECVFLNFTRLLYKDEIKKGNFNLQVYTGGSVTGALSASTSIVDTGAQNDFRVNSPVGEYAVLSASNGFFSGSNPGQNVGLIYYQAGIVVLTASVFNTTGSGDSTQDIQDFSTPTTGAASINAMLTGATIQTACDALRARWLDLDMNNTVELNSTIFFVRANHDEFNYSSNPTYLSESKLVVKNNTTDEPVSYVTTIGLYSSDNELMAVAKTSEPIKKTPSNEVTFRVRLDY